MPTSSVSSGAKLAYSKIEFAKMNEDTKSEAKRLTILSAAFDSKASPRVELDRRRDLLGDLLYDLVLMNPLQSVLYLENDPMR